MRHHVRSNTRPFARQHFVATRSFDYFFDSEVGIAPTLALQLRCCDPNRIRYLF